MFNEFIKLIAAILVLIGVILIYDSRIITKRFFGFGDQNEGTLGLKVIGFIAVVVGGLVFYFFK